MNEIRTSGLFIRRMLPHGGLFRMGFFLAVCMMTPGFLSAADFSEKVVTSAKSCTLQIFTDKASGTGFVLNRKGHIVTNYHVIEGSSKISVIFVDGDKAFEVSASVVATAPGKDLAILICDMPFRIKPFALVSRETIGNQSVMALGFPGVLMDKFSPSSSEGIRPTGKPGEYILNSEAISLLTPVVFQGNVGKEMPIDSGYGGTFKAIAHSAKISEGNSGGPLIDLDGRVVGVNVQVAGSGYGIDYSFAIHASELIALARAHSIPFDVTSSKATGSGGVPALHMMLFIVLAAFAVVMFLMVLRKPRAVMVEAMSRVIRSTKHDHAQHSPRQAHNPAAARGGHARQSVSTGSHSSMRLRGRDFQGLSFDVAFSGADFRRHGGRLVIGRNKELSQLVIPHDSVSRQHATLSMNGSLIEVEDRNSGNGTMVNGREISVGAPPMPLKPGDKLTLGEVDLIFEIFN